MSKIVVGKGAQPKGTKWATAQNKCIARTPSTVCGLRGREGQEDRGQLQEEGEKQWERKKLTKAGERLKKEEGSTK